MLKGFSLLEILLTITALGILFAISFISLNPNLVIQENDDNQAEIKALDLYQALEQYALDNQGYPPDITNMASNSVAYICKSGATSCLENINLNLLVPTYLPSLPTISNSSLETGFYIIKKANNRIGVGAINTADNQSFVKGLDSQNFTQPLPVIRNGLLAYLDAANPASYPGSGTTWTNLSGTGNNASLLNGVSFSNQNKGSLVFDGLNDYVNSNYSPQLSTGNSYAHSVWFRTNAATVGDNGSNRLVEARDGNKTGSPLIASMLNFSTNNTLVFLVRGANGIRRDLIVNNIPVNDNNWRQVHFQILANGHTQIYLNGSLAGENTSGVDTNIDLSSRFLAIGARNLEGNISGFFNGNIAQVSIYNRALSAQEVQQNFQATKTRFGL